MVVVLNSEGVFLALKGFPCFEIRFGEFLCKPNGILSVYRGVMFAWLYGVAGSLSRNVRHPTLIGVVIQNS